MENLPAIFNSRRLIIAFLLSFILSWFISMVLFPSFIIKITLASHHEILTGDKCCKSHLTLHHDSHGHIAEKGVHQTNTQTLVSDFIFQHEQNHHDHEICLPDYEQKFYLSKFLKIDAERGPPLFTIFSINNHNLSKSLPLNFLFNYKLIEYSVFILKNIKLLN